MSDQDDKIRSKAAVVTELLKNQRSNRSQFAPTSGQIIRAINPEPISLINRELPEVYTSEDYDRWVMRALEDLFHKPQRFHRHPDNPVVVECPRERVLRIGREAEASGQPSALFRELMKLTDNGAKLPHVTKRALDAAQNYLDIALKFREFVASKSKYREYKNDYPALKAHFRRSHFTHLGESTIDRALSAYDLGWSAYAVANPRKGKRNKRVIS